MKKNRFLNALRFPFLFIVVIWAIHIVQFVFRMDFGYLGIYPRHVVGLKGILTSPMIHADFQHLINNSIPLFAMTALILFFFPRIAWRSFGMIYILTGLVVWVFARSVFHIGASGVVYGLVSFVFWTGIFRRNVKSIILSLIVLFYYSSMFLGVLPNQEGISWESHLIGGIVGIFVAFWFREEIEEDEKPKLYSWDRDNEIGNEQFYLDRDIFEKTKQEREQEQKNDDWFSSGTW